MELYLDSVNFDEIKTAFSQGYFSGLTTTPTFMHRHGIKDIDGAIVQLSGLVPVLQVEALGDTAEDIVSEARRIQNLPLQSAEMVFKIPISLEGLRACKMLTSEGHKVNIHLIYTLNQAYLAMEAGASYICPLVGRLHDQGHDAMMLIDQCVEVVDRYGYGSKVMVSSVRHAEHVRQALLCGAHCVTLPWGVMKMLTTNALTDVGTAQFVEHTALMTNRVKDVIRPENPTCKRTDKVMDVLVTMTESKLGAVSVVDDKGKLIGIFTDGDIRRQLKEKGKALLEADMGSFEYKKPITLPPDALLYEAVNFFTQHQVDTIIVSENDLPVGMLDIQDFVKKGFLS